ncbi:hypothetical protein Rumeso_02335 [Rubellimicrobium mesophilum DSM 19309]|uniref:Uncharacterized protein n=1 Tax=Rubellimicrobium mesophilum DSM 19309 TaxID=442562 RepID=A0A017HP43_9RHOB|nr:hypothetical protein Rumeso_02335 [Rubellimicrobium mesophilum DSM 19309]
MRVGFDRLLGQSPHGPLRRIREGSTRALRRMTEHPEDIGRDVGREGRRAVGRLDLTPACRKIPFHEQIERASSDGLRRCGGHIREALQDRLILRDLAFTPDNRSADGRVAPR